MTAIRGRRIAHRARAREPRNPSAKRHQQQPRKRAAETRRGQAIDERLKLRNRRSSMAALH